ncbi:MAG: hypothetical protein V4507_06955 [Verrucomicrobiota bacterium]
MSSPTKSIIVISQNIVEGKSDPDEEFSFSDTLPLLINRFGYSTHQTQDVLSALLTNGKVRIHNKEIWQRLRLKNAEDRMTPEEAENLVNATLAEHSPGLMRILIQQAPKTDLTICVSIRKPRHWKDLVVGDKCNGYYEDETGKKITIFVEITEIAPTGDFHRARGSQRHWFVASPEAIGVGSPNFYYLLPDQESSETQ